MSESPVGGYVLYVRTWWKLRTYCTVCVGLCVCVCVYLCASVYNAHVSRHKVTHNSTCAQFADIRLYSSWIGISIDCFGKDFRPIVQIIWSLKVCNICHMKVVQNNYDWNKDDIRGSVQTKRNGKSWSVAQPSFQDVDSINSFNIIWWFTYSWRCIYTLLSVFSDCDDARFKHYMVECMCITWTMNFQHMNVQGDFLHWASL